MVISRFGTTAFLSRNISCHFMHNQMYSLQTLEGMATFIIFVVTCVVISLCQTTPNSPEYYLAFKFDINLIITFYMYVVVLIVLILQACAFRREGAYSTPISFSKINASKNKRKVPVAPYLKIFDLLINI